MRNNTSRWSNDYVKYTTSLVPKTFNGVTSTFVDSIADNEPNLTDIFELSDGTYLIDSSVVWYSHGFTVGDWYYLSQTVPGTFTNVEPVAGLVQKQFFVENEHTIHLKLSNIVQSGGTTCPAPMTRSALRSLRSSGGLSKECHYVLTDYNRGTVGAATIMLHAVDANTLSQTAMVKTSFDTLSWSGRYDIDSNRLLELNDHIGNKVSGQEVVDTFPWGNNAVSDNIVHEPGSFAYTSGTFTDNFIGTGANVIINSSSGNFVRNKIDADSNVSWLSGDVRENVFATDCIANINTTGDFDNNNVNSLSRIDITGTGNMDSNYIGQSSNVTIAAGTMSDNVIGSDCTLTSGGGTIYENNIQNSSTITLTSAQAFYHNSITRDSSIIVGNHPFYAMTVSKSSINTTGSTGNGLRYGKIMDCTAFTAVQNVGTLDWAYFSFSNNSSASITGATRSYMRYGAFENYGRLLQTAGTQIDLNYVGARDNGYFRTQQGRLYVSRTTVSHVSYIDNNSTGTNRVDSVKLESRSRARFLGTSNNCRIYYCSASSGSNIEHRGGSTSCYFYYCSASSSSSLYTNNSVNLRGYYNSVSGNSELSSQGMTGTHYFYYCTAHSHGYLRLRDGLGRMYAVNASAQSVVQITGGTVASRLYYSSFASYYYLYLNSTNLTTTRHSLRGTGRRSYTPATTFSNGTYTQNF